MYQFYNVVFQNILKLIFAAVRTSDLKLQDQFVIVSNSLEQNPSGAAEPLSKNSTTCTEIDGSLPTSQEPTIWLTLSYYLRYSLT